MLEKYVPLAKTVALSLLAFSSVGYVYYYGQSLNQSFPNRTFSVNGDAKMETATDIALFTVSVVTEGGKNVASIQKQNIEKMNAINAFLGDQGVEKKDLQTNEYTLRPRYDYAECMNGSCPAPIISGYTLTQSLSVKVRNFDVLGDILSGVVLNGANSVSEVRFVVDDTTEAKQKARNEAIIQAKEKATEIAKAGNFRIGKLISIYEDTAISPLDSINDGIGGGRYTSMSVKSEVPPIIEPGTQSGRVSVNLTYEILDK